MEMEKRNRLATLQSRTPSQIPPPHRVHRLRAVPPLRLRVRVLERGKGSLGRCFLSFGTVFLFSEASSVSLSSCIF